MPNLVSVACGARAACCRSPRRQGGRRLVVVLLSGCLMLLAAAPPAGAQFLQEPTPNRQDTVIRSSTAVLGEIMSIPLAGIPTSLLADAHGVAIIPNVLKGGFVIGARYGRGVLLVRDESGHWHAPVFITLTGGNVGWQAGIQATDLVLVFRTRRSVDGILAGKFTLGADAAAAAGPVGRQAAAATDGNLAAEILSYSRSRGLFAGVSVDGSVMQVDGPSTDAYYQRSTVAGAGSIDGGQMQVPVAAQQLTAMVAGYTGRTTVEVAPAGYQALHVPQPAVPGGDALRHQLAQAATALNESLDDSWRTYLSLPGEVFDPAAQPSVAAMQASLRQFDRIAADPRYQDLAMHPQFQATHRLLKNYADSLAQSPAPLQLPPPPAINP